MALVHPDANGENLTVSAMLVPGDKIAGKLNGEIKNSVPLRFKAETVTLVGALFVKTTVWVSECPMRTSPKTRLEGEQVNCCATAWEQRKSMATAMIGTTRVQRRWTLDWGSLIELFSCLPSDLNRSR